MKTRLLFLLTFLTVSLGWGQIYQHNFGTTAISTKPYTGAPSTLDTNLTNSSWTTSVTTFGGLAGNGGNPSQSLSLSNSSGTPTMTLTFDVTAGYQISISQFNFWRVRSSSGAQNWSMTINGTNVGSGTTPTTGAALGNTNVSNPITNLTGTITVVISFSGASGTGTCRIDDFTLLGAVTSISGGGSPEINLKGNSVSIVDGDTTPVTTDHTDFGTVATSTNMARVYTIENTGSAVLNITSITMASGTDFVVSGAPSSVAAGSSTTFTVTFNSAVGGTFTNTVTIISDDTDEATYTFDVKAIAQAPTPNIAVKGNNNVIAVGDTTPSTTDHTDFGSNGTSTNVVKTYTIENTGTGVLTVNDILMSNAPASKYTIGGISLPTTVAAGSSTTFTVTFNSAAAGTFADNVLIDNDDPTDGIYDFAVTGTAVALNFSVGDISILGLSADAVDSFSFVNWVPIPDGAILYFTDCSYDENSLLKTNEGTKVWTNSTGASIPVGTVITVSTATNTTDSGTVTAIGSFDANAGGETILLYEGSASSPNFIHGMSKGPWITTGVVANSNSYLPASLNVTNGNIVLGTSDNYEYNNSRDNQESMADYKTMVNTPANYKSSNTYFALSSEDFKLAVVWETAAWSNTTGPTSSLSAVIKDVYNTTTNGAIVAKDLTVKTGGSVTVEATNPVTIHGNIINNLTETAFVVNNGGSILQPNTTTNNNTGNITYKRTTSTLAHNLDLVYWGSPVDNQTLSGMWMTTANDTFYTFDTAAAGGENWAYAAPSTIMQAAKGYVARAVNGTGNPVWTPGNSWTANFIGKPNNGDISFTMLNEGGANIDNLMANPYPSAIDLILFRNDADNSAKLTGNFFFWTHNTAISGGNTYSNSDYTILNVALGASVATSPSGPTPLSLQFVAAGQGFFAEAAIAGIVSFKNTHRVAGNNNAFYKQINNTNVVNSDKIWLNLSNTNGLFKQQLLAYTQNATIDFDPNYDAKSFEGNADIDFYSIIPNKNLAIQSRPTFTDNDVVPIGYKSSITGNFSIAIDHSDGLFAAGQTVYLQDNLLGIDFDLLQGAYNFTTNSGTFNNRFVLKYTSALSTTDNDLSANNVIVAKNSRQLKIKSVIKNISSISVFDLLGRKIIEENNLDTNEFITTAPKDQVLIVKITLVDGTKIAKKVN